jgi:hypothetical protein
VIKIVLALILVAHGVGHSLGILQVLRVAIVNPQWSGDSWLLTGPFGNTAAHAAGIAVWTAAIVGFGAVAAVVLGWLPSAWWAPLAIASSVASLVGLVLFPVAFPTASTVGALAVDLAVLGSVIWLNWAPDQVVS